jgi:hypothetical protein
LALNPFAVEQMLTAATEAGIAGNTPFLFDNDDEPEFRRP